MRTEVVNYINHIALVLDASLSMSRHADRVVEVADAEIRHIAEKSRELDQETRVTVYSFSDEPRCLVYDKDALRLPSLAGLYEVRGNTALIAATWQALDDLEKTAQLYGDHAFLVYVLTDGEENVSRWSKVFDGPGGGGYRSRFDRTPYGTSQLGRMLATRLQKLPENWTLGALVPDAQGRRHAEGFGFPADNVATWDATSDRGVEAAVAGTIRAATTSYMTGRASGVRGTKTLFAGGAAQVNAQARKAAGLRVVPRDTYELLGVGADDDGAEIRAFVERRTGAAYHTGRAFYQLSSRLGGTKSAEKIQPHKRIMVRDRKSGRVYAGGHARKLLGLPDNVEARVKPEDNEKYQVFVQSTSVNRKLVAGTKLLLLLGDPA